MRSSLKTKNTLVLFFLTVSHTAKKIFQIPSLTRDATGVNKGILP
jgi:hypothetical protein